MAKSLVTMRIEASAKVNFTLEVLGKRVDGFHALRSVVMPVSLADTLDIEATEDGVIASDTGYPDDLCLKAARILRCAAGERCASCGATIRVTKRIPAGGGLGGGSADAAAVLRALNELWKVNLPLADLAALGAQAGSDVPALVLAQALNAPVLMEGRGEFVRPLFPSTSRLAPRLSGSVPPPFSILLVNPGVFSSTPEVFKACTPRGTDDPSILKAMEEALASGDVRAVAAALQNDLEAPACRLHPEIARVKDALVEAGALGVRMSGSGSTVFALVATEAAGRELAGKMEARGYRAWCATSTRLV